MPPKQTTIPTLHNLASSQAFRCLWAFEEIALLKPTFTYKLENYPRIRGPNPDIIKHHRLGKSPILCLETTDGSPPPTIQLEPGVLTESKLILEFINAEYARRMWDAKTEEDKRRDTFLSEFATATLTMKVTYTLIFDMLRQFSPWPLSYLVGLMTGPLVRHFKEDLLPCYQLLEDALSEEKPWFGGENMGLSDFNMSFGMDMADQRGYGDVGKYPKLREWTRRIRGREAYRRAVVKGEGYDFVTFGVK